MLKCNQLVLGYTDAMPLSQAFDLTLADNTWAGIIGVNGIGKSTFLKTILGIIPPISGKLSVLNAMPKQCNAAISYIPQERETNLTQNMSGFSLINNSYHAWHYGINILDRKLKQRTIHLLELVNASSYMYQPFNTLSGGQKKRIYLAQALINEPRLLLLDEPLADLDPQARHNFIEALQQIRSEQNLGMLIIAHDMHEIASHLDSFIHFKAGGLIHNCNTLPCVMEDAYVGI